MLHIHRAERADVLVGALARLLADPLPDELAAEVVAVPTRGMERWLTQRLSATLGASPQRADGVCANVDFPSPRRLAAAVVAAASGIDPERDPWPAERLAWSLLEVVEAALHEPWLAALAAHVGAGGDDDGSRRARRLTSVRRVAELFDRYALLRPAMLRAWAAGDDHDATGRALAPDARWQAELWRRLRARLQVPDPAARLERACRRLRAEPGLAALPPRLALFGLTRLAPATVEALAALAHGRDVHLYALHPSPALWARVAERLGGEPVVRRARDVTARLPRNRLLASWGQDARELQLVLHGAGAALQRHHALPASQPATLLERLQADVRADRPPPAPGARAPIRLAPGDRSVQIHACHGRSRQVEVLRDAILHLLADDATLEPRDVIVMCPDVETFAPLIEATFGAGELAADDDGGAAAHGTDLRVRLADRSLRQTNAVLGVVGALLDVAGGRVTASEVLDLADREPVRRRFGFDDDDLARIKDWITASGIRWGLDAEHRRPFKLDALGDGTWRAGIDRVLLGVTTTEHGAGMVGGVLALDDVDSGAIELAGRLAELVDRLAAVLDALAQEQPIEAWAASLAAAADALTRTTPAGAWQRGELQRLLDDVTASATAAGATPLALPELRALLAEQMAGRPTRANFRTGHLTVCTLMPMRSVPHRVVCLLGLDDGAFPRRTARDGDDLVLDDAHVGDRDPRSEDRQLLLDALLAATDRLVVTYTGNDERTNLVRPPAVPVGELLDAIDATARGAGDEPARAQVLVRHPLQPFDARNFVAAAHAGGRPWSFDRVTLAGARALAGARPQPAAFLAEPLPPPADDAATVVELDDLVRFVAHPARAFLRQRLGVSVGDFATAIRDDLPVELDGLERWRVGQRLLDALLAGVPIDVAIDVERARGQLPPGRLADPVIARLRPIAERIAAAADALSGPRFEPRSLEVNVELGGGRRLSGAVGGVGGDVVRGVSFASVTPAARLAAWVRLLALGAAHPQRELEALTIGRARRNVAHGTLTVARIGALGDDARQRRAIALEQLAMLVDLRDRGLREPPPIAMLASAAYARAAADGRDAVAAARRQWQSDHRPIGEDCQPEHVLVHDGVRAFEALLAQPPRADEAGPGWHDEQPSRFGRYALRLWAGLLEREQVTDR